MEQAKEVLGMNDCNLKALEKALPLKVVARGQELTISGSRKAVEDGARVLDHLLALSARREIVPTDMQYALTLIGQKPEADTTDRLSEVLLTTSRGKQIRRRPSVSIAISNPFGKRTSPSASALPVQARPIWLW